MISAVPILALLLFASAPATQPASAPVDEKEEMRLLIDSFLASPADDERAARIRKFTDESPDVSVWVDATVLPWTTHEPKYPQAALLVVVYFAGNVRSQLESGANADDAYAGLQEVFRVYRDMQQKQPELHIPEIDQFMELDKQWKLRPYLAEAASGQPPPTTEPATQPAGR